MQYKFIILKNDELSDFEAELRTGDYQGWVIDDISWCGSNVMVVIHKESA